MKAFQQNAFQDNAFQMTDTPPPTPGGGGGGGGGGAWTAHDEAHWNKRSFIRKQLERAIRAELMPEAAKDERKPVKLWTRPQRAKVFPNYWKELQVTQLLDVGLNDLAAVLAQLVAERFALWQAQQQELEDAEALQALMVLLSNDII